MTWTLQDAKNRFSAVVEAAWSGGPQEVSRRGGPAVVVPGAADDRHLIDGAVERRESFAGHLPAFPTPGVERAQVTPRDVEFRV